MKRNATGEWIKLGRDLWTHPKVRRIADILGRQWQPELPLSDAVAHVQVADNSRTIRPDMHGHIRTTVLVHAVVSGLSRLFLTVNRHASEAADGTLDAILTDMTTDTYLDDVSGLPGLQAAMTTVGWAVHDKARGVIRLPHYLEHNVLHKGAKRVGAPGNPASKDAQRKREARAAKRGQSTQDTTGQLPDNSRTIRPDTTGQLPDNAAEKSRAETKTHVEKNGQPSGQPPPVGVVNGHRSELQTRVDALRPAEWATLPHWTQADLDALARTASALDAMCPHGWKLLAWFFRWCADPWNAQHRPEESRVTGSRAKFLDSLGDYHARASRLWHAEKRPRLEPPPPKPQAQAPDPTAEPSPTVTPTEFRTAIRAAISAP